MPTIIRERDLAKERQRENNRQGTAYYNTKGWRAIRNAYIRSHPLCERCQAKGIVTPAEEVHHKVEFLSGNTEYERKQLFTDPTNLMSVCKRCHLEIHNERRQERKEGSK